jgi:hypothetical protein
MSILDSLPESHRLDPDWERAEEVRVDPDEARFMDDMLMELADIARVGGGLEGLWNTETEKQK